MNITNLINKDMIFLDQAFDRKDDVILTLSKRLFANEIINSIEGFVEAVIERESQTTTAVGFGIAIPHARSKYVRKPGIAIVRSKEFLWDSESKQSVSLVFLLAVPEQIEYPEYMRILASISRMLVHRRFREALLKADNVDIFISEIFNGERYLVNGKHKSQ